MTKTLILRFRDLVTPSGGSIAQHKQYAAENGRVWWSWWKRQTELCPEQFFLELRNAIVDRPAYPAFGFDSGTGKLYLTRLQGIALAPSGLAIKTPDASLTPEFCHQGEYSAWFLYGPVFHEVPLDQAYLEYDSFPSNPDAEVTHANLIGARITSAKEMRQVDATMYAVKFDDASFACEI